MATPPPPPGGPGFGNFPQQQQQPLPQQQPGGAQGFGPPPGLPASPGMPVPPGLAPTAGTPAVGGAPGGSGRPGSLRRNAVWAFVGALLASAGWATAVVTVPGLVSDDGDTGPLSVRGYRVVDDLCTVAKLSQLQTIYTTPDDTPYHNTNRHDALDTMYCSLQLKQSSSSSSADYASVYLRAELHKAVNPTPEFTANKAAWEKQRYQITAVTGLGDEAYLAYRDEPSSTSKTWHNVTHELNVRDGGVTFYLSWSDSYETDKKNDIPDRDKIKQALIADTREALKAIGGKG